MFTQGFGLTNRCDAYFIGSVKFGNDGPVFFTHGGMRFKDGYDCYDARSVHSDGANAVFGQFTTFSTRLDRSFNHSSRHFSADNGLFDWTTGTCAGNSDGRARFGHFRNGTTVPSSF